MKTGRRSFLMGVGGATAAALAVRGKAAEAGLVQRPTLGSRQVLELDGEIVGAPQSAEGGGASAVVSEFLDSAFVVRKDSGIMSTRELKGKTIGVPSPAGQLAMAAVLKSHGLGENDYKVRYLSYTAQAAGLQDRNIDAGYMVVHRINSTVTEFMTTTGGRILGFDDAKAVEYFESNYPVWRAVALKAKIYPGQDEEIRVAGRHGLVLASKEVPADLVYDFVKTLFANPQQLTAIHPAASDISLEQTKQYYDKKLFVVPLHPGAERWYREHGFKV